MFVDPLRIQARGSISLQIRRTSNLCDAIKSNKKLNKPGHFYPVYKQAIFHLINFYENPGHKQAKNGGVEVKKWPA